MSLPIAGLIACLIIVWWAAVVDLRTFTIPHAFSWALMALWIPFALVAMQSGVGLGVLAVQALGGLIAFVIGVVFFALGVMGGGDVKLLAALTPLIPFGTLPVLFVLIALSGLVWALAYGSMRFMQARRAGESDALATARMARLPYGPAIAMGLSLYSVALVLLA